MDGRRVYLVLTKPAGRADLRLLPERLWVEELNESRAFDVQTGVWPLEFFIVDTPRQAQDSAIAIADLDYVEEGRPAPTGAPAEWYEPESAIKSIDRLLQMTGRRAAAVDPIRAELLALRAEFLRAQEEGAMFHFVEPSA